MRAAQDVKIAQLQTSALDTLSLILRATGAGHQLHPDQRTAIKEQLNSMITDNRSSAIKSHAADTLTLLAAGQDAQMHDAPAQ